MYNKMNKKCIISFFKIDLLFFYFIALKKFETIRFKKIIEKVS